MAWPTRAAVWHDMDVALREYAGVADAIAAFEPVLMVVNPGDAPVARRMLSGDVDLIELPIDDSWMRDNGPIFVVNGAGECAGVHFRLNALRGSGCRPGTRMRPWASRCSRSSGFRGSRRSWCWKAARSASTARARSSPRSSACSTSTATRT